MFDINFINDKVKQFSDEIPAEAKKFKHELTKNFRAALQSMFAELDLVTREEFDVQKGVLAKTRAKINALSKQLEQLEKNISKAQLQEKDK